MPKFNQVAPTFLVNDVGAAIRWYKSELGFATYPFPKNPPFVFASIVVTESRSCASASRGHRKPDLYQLRDGGVWDAYIRVTGIRDFYRAVKDRVEIKMSLRQQPYGDWEFEIKDPNGYILVFSERID